MEVFYTVSFLEEFSTPFHFLFINSRNHRFDPLEWLHEIEPHRIVQLHLAGYSRSGDRYTDNHSQAIQEELIEPPVPWSATGTSKPSLWSGTRIFPPFRTWKGRLKNCKKFVTSTDFITVLGRLLRDGAMRDALAAHPHVLAGQLHLSESDRKTLMQIPPPDLEFQASVLINKRLDLVRCLIPETCLRLGAETGPTFHRYARNQWVPDDPGGIRDARQFCRYLESHRPDSLSRIELNRLCFLTSKRRLDFHFVQWRRLYRRSRPGLQILLRSGPHDWREVVFSFSL